MINKSVSALVKELDKVFSEFIRRRDSQDGYGKCCTCSWVGPWKNADCGHFISRGEYSVRWDERNVALQCKRCNAFRGGEQALFAKYIDKRWGEGTADKLQVLRRRSQKLDRLVLQARIIHYKQELKKLSA